jgi:hypothetical protein
MTQHLTARLAWHDDGWNGHVCRNPAANTYCVGHYSRRLGFWWVLGTGSGDRD